MYSTADSVFVIIAGGTFSMLDICSFTNVKENIGKLPQAPMLFTFSVMHCMSVSLAHEGGGRRWRAGFKGGRGGVKKDGEVLDGSSTS